MAKQGEQAKRGPVEAAALFPRLHVSHAKRDNGPRPPPRNKMALYEQVTLQSKGAKPAAGTSSQQQEEATGGSGMPAPKTRIQAGESLPSMVSPTGRKRCALDFCQECSRDAHHSHLLCTSLRLQEGAHCGFLPATSISVADLTYSSGRMMGVCPICRMRGVAKPAFGDCGK
jgi:hypothetical protein